MLGSGLLDLGIALSVVFFLLSLLASGLAELIESLAKKRATYLRLGLEQLLPKYTAGPSEKTLAIDFVKRLYGNPLITALYRGQRFPSYIPSRTFALALVSEISKGLDADGPAALAVGPATVQGVLGALPRKWKPAEAIASLAVEAKNDFDGFLGGIADWYDASMDRVSGWYKRYSQGLLLLLGLGLATCLNADAISMARAVASDSVLRQSLVTTAGSIASTNAITDASGRVLVSYEELQSLKLPLGWTREEKGPRHIPDSAGEWLLKVVGLCLTALAISFGAPFWFDLVNRFVTIRSTVKPPANATSQT